MTPNTVFVLGVTASGAAGLLVVATIGRKLHRVLIDLCGGEDRAGFWATSVSVLLVVVPVLGALGQAPEGIAGSPLLDLARQLRWGLAGIIATLAVVSWVMARWIAGRR